MSLGDVVIKKHRQGFRGNGEGGVEGDAPFMDLRLEVRGGRGVVLAFAAQGADRDKLVAHMRTFAGDNALALLMVGDFHPLSDGSVLLAGVVGTYP